MVKNNNGYGKVLLLSFCNKNIKCIKWIKNNVPQITPEIAILKAVKSNSLSMVHIACKIWYNNNPNSLSWAIATSLDTGRTDIYEYFLSLINNFDQINICIWKHIIYGMKKYPNMLNWWKNVRNLSLYFHEVYTYVDSFVLSQFLSTNDIENAKLFFKLNTCLSVNDINIPGNKNTYCWLLSFVPETDQNYNNYILYIAFASIKNGYNDLLLQIINCININTDLFLEAIRSCNYEAINILHNAVTDQCVDDELIFDTIFSCLKHSDNPEILIKIGFILEVINEDDLPTVLNILIETGSVLRVKKFVNSSIMSTINWQILDFNNDKLPIIPYDPDLIMTSWVKNNIKFEPEDMTDEAINIISRLAVRNNKNFDTNNRMYFSSLWSSNEQMLEKLINLVNCTDLKLLKQIIHEYGTGVFDIPTAVTPISLFKELSCNKILFSDFDHEINFLYDRIDAVLYMMNYIF